MNSALLAMAMSKRVRVPGLGLIAKRRPHDRLMAGYMSTLIPETPPHNGHPGRTP